MNPEEQQSAVPDYVRALQQQRSQSAPAAPQQQDGMAALRGLAGTISAAAEEAGQTIVEIPGAALHGVSNAIGETLDAVDGAATWLNENVADTRGLLPAWAEPSVESLKPEWGSSGTTVGASVVEGVAQFVTGWIGAGRMLKTLKLPAAGSTAGKVGGAMAKGAAVDATVFDPHEARLSDLVERYPALANPITAYLASDPEDGEAEGRFKNAVEGLLLGGVTEALLWSLKGLRAAHKGDLGAAEEAAEKADAALSGGEGKPAASPEATPGGTADAPEAAAETSPPVSDSPPAGRIFVDQDKAQEVYAAIARSRDSGMEDLPAFSRHFNFGLWNTEGDVKAAINAISDQFEGPIREAVGGDESGVRSWADVQQEAGKLAGLLGEDPALLTQRMSQQSGSLARLDSDLRAYNTVLVSLADYVTRLASGVEGLTGKHAVAAATEARTKALAEGKLPEEATALANAAAQSAQAADGAEFVRGVELLANVQAMYKGLQTNVARAMNAMKLGAGVNRKLTEGWDLQRLATEMQVPGGPKELQKLAARVKAMAGNPAGLTKLVRGSFGGRLLNAHNEYFINALLSGLPTHTINFLSNAATSLYLPGERMLAGAFRGSRAEVREGADQYLALGSTLLDAFKAAGAALRSGEPILDPGRSTNEVTARAISASNLGVQQVPLLRELVDGIGTVVNLPSRLLVTQDEFFKVMNYRAYVTAAALREGRMQGLDGEGLSRFVAGRLEQATDSLGKGTREEGLAYARETTFTGDLGYGIGQDIQQLVARNPWLRPIMPFIRTPTNILRFTWRRTPVLGQFQRQWKEDYRAGGERRARALAHVTMGAALYTTAGFLYSAGVITGGGPSEPDQQAALRETGWQPYSIKVGGTYYAYSRADPFGMFLGLAADVVEGVGTTLDEGLAGELALGGAMAVAKNLSSKTYLSGVVSWMNALSDAMTGQGVQGLTRGAARQAGAYVPAFVARLTDDEAFREVRSILDGLRARSPWHSADLDPRRNVLGEIIARPGAIGPDVVSPIAVTSDQQDPVADALAELVLDGGATFRPPFPKLLGTTLDLRTIPSPVSGKSAYDRLQELTGTIRLGGKTLRERLAELVASPAWARMTTGSPDAPGSRADAVQGVLGAYREAARQKLLQEDPVLARAIREDLKRLNRAKAQEPPEFLQ